MMMRYPLRDDPHSQVRTRTGRTLDEITLEAVRNGEVTLGDLSIHPDTLRAQAEIATQAGFPHLGANLRRAAELAQMPNEKVLEVYEALRPRRLRYEGLLALADELEHEYGAVENALLIREAAEAYRASRLA
jgi:propanediol dehydratase small subunit